MNSPILFPTITSLKESSTLAINQKVLDLREKGEDICHLGFGQSPFPVPPRLQEALQKNAFRKNYLPTLGLKPLREVFCEFYKKQHGYDFEPDCVIVGPGSKELIFQTLFCLEGPLIIPAPSWVSYGPQAHIRGKTVHVVQTKKENDYKLTAEELQQACDTLLVNRQKILILNNPNNPTGAVYKDHELKSLSEVARDQNVIIISDEIYSMINWETEAYRGLSHYYPEGTIVTSGLSKSFSAGGYRLGILAAPSNMRSVIRALAAMVSETFSAVSAPTQYAAIAAYDRHPEVMDYVQRCSDIHKATGQYMFSRLKDLGAGCVEPKGAFYLFPDFNSFIPKLKKKGVLDSLQMCHLFLDELKVATLPSSDFFLPADYLACRMATVDYDGEKALEAAKSRDVLDKTFVEDFCPHLKAACDRLENFFKQLT